MPPFEVACTVEKCDDSYLIRLYLVEKAIAEYEDLSEVGVVPLRHHTASFAQRGERLGRSQRLLEDAERALRGFLGDKIYCLIESCLSPGETRLLSAEPPLAPELSFNLLVGDAATFIELLEALLDLRQHVEVIKHVLKRALVGQTVEEVANGLFRLHVGLLEGPVEHRTEG